jgi:hypothetical protein
MTTPSTSASATTVPVGVPHRSALRLRMGPTMGADRLDGAWWPQSRDLAVELADLVDHFPAKCGRVVRALFSPPDWDPAPRRIPVAAGYVKVGSFPRDDTHLIELKTSDRSVLQVLVVPPEFTEGQGADALLAAATVGNAHSASEVLAGARPDLLPDCHWEDDGGSWRSENRPEHPAPGG